jgi:hypothetical protein
MEALLVWAVVIAAIAIVFMLALLFASERELKRKRLEIDALRSKLESSAAALPATAAPADAQVGSSSEIPHWAEQIRANEIAMANMQCELEALRAENSWLKRESTARQNQSTPGRQAPFVRTSVPGQRSAADFALDVGARRGALLLPAAAGALLLVALVSVFFVRGRSNVVPPTRRVELHRQTPPISAGTEITRSPDAANPSGSEATSSRPGAKEESKSRSSDAGKDLAARPPTGAPQGLSYEVVRSTRVFSEPHERSRALARVEAGMEIVVVGARNGWLEVRSRHGRPPGFIRKDAVIRKR